MKTGIKLIALISVILNVLLCYSLFFKTENIDRKPPWHPFKLNSNLTLKSIVKNGYRFEDGQCGLINYSKKIADTIITYTFNIDCNKYEGKVKWDIQEETIQISDSSDNVTTDYSFKKTITENKYHPWKLNEIKGCYEKIWLSSVYISLGKKIDSSSVREYIRKKGGVIERPTQKWNSKSGGHFIVYNYENKLLFNCRIKKTEDEWELIIERKIPLLDQKRMKKDRKHQIKKDYYYDIFTE